MMIKRCIKELIGIKLIERIVLLLWRRQKDLIKVIQKGNTYIVDCISMWIFNNLDESQETLIKQLEHIETLDCNIVFCFK